MTPPRCSFVYVWTGGCVYMGEHLYACVIVSYCSEWMKMCIYFYTLVRQFCLIEACQVKGSKWQLHFSDRFACVIGFISLSWSWCRCIVVLNSELPDRTHWYLRGKLLFVNIYFRLNYCVWKCLDVNVSLVCQHKDIIPKLCLECNTSILLTAYK